MALRLLAPEEWVPPPPTKITTRPAWQPRDERVRIPKSPHRGRPKAIQLLGPPASMSMKSPPLPHKLVNDNDHTKITSPRDPEIVDLAAPTTWPRRYPPSVPPKQAPLVARMGTPSLYSRHSTAGQSEISFGILDYYTRDPSPLNSPDLPPPPATKVEGVVSGAMEKFDFELAPTTPKSIERKPLAVSKTEDVVAGAQQRSPVKTTSPAGRLPEDAMAGAALEQQQEAVNITPPTRRAPDVPHKRMYSLFPAIQETPSPSTDALPSKLPASPTESPSHVATHQQPDPSYRPRKESLTSSIRSRKDSFTSFRSNRRIPLRILSSTSTASTSNRTFSTTSTSTHTNSPPDHSGGHRSRWSDDTITSPTAATTPGPRTSFGSLLKDFSGSHGGGRVEGGSGRFPDCFFEDDEDLDQESVPLRRGFRGWKGSGQVNVREMRRYSKGRFDAGPSLGYRMKRLVLCGGCGGGGRRRGRAGTI